MLHWSWTWYQIQSKPIKVSVMNRMKLETASGRSLSVFHPLAACLFVGGNIIIPPKVTKLQLRLFNNLRFQHRSVRNRSPKFRPKSTNSALLVLTSVCSRRKFEPLMLNLLPSTWRKSSHKHWTIPEQRSPHLLYLYKTRAILAVWLYSGARNILTIDAKFAQKQFSRWTAMCGQDNKNVTVSLNTWKLKHLLSRTAMLLVASQLRISRLFTIWRKLYFSEYFS